MVSALEIAEGSIALLEKAAQEADALDLAVQNLRRENLQLKASYEALSKQAAAPKMDRGLLLKLARLLEDSDMLVDGLTAEKLAADYESDPNRLAGLALHILCPVQPDGRPAGKSASTPSPGAPKEVRFDGRTLTDEFGFMNALR